MVSKKKEESVHVCLTEHLKKRRDILQTTIDIVQLLKRYDNIKRLRQEKEAAYLEFRKTMGSVNFLLRKIKVKDMPLNDDDLKAFGTKIERTPVKVVVKEPVIKQVKKALIKKEKKEDTAKMTLDRQLEDLKRKLNSL